MKLKDGDEAYNSVKWALEAGYRHIDTAYVYENEDSVGKAIKDSKIKREELFITTKLPSDIKTYDGAIEYFNKSLELLGLDYIDLYLIHAPWPWSNVGQNCDEGNILAWKAMIDLYNEGKIRSIGVSNFSIKDIENIVKATNFKPMVNQIRYFIGNTKLKEMADKYNTTIPKICLRFCLQNNTLPLPKSVHKERIYDNLEFNFIISDEDMAYLNSLDKLASTRLLRY